MATNNDVNVLLQTELFNIIVELAIISYSYPGDKSKRILKYARYYQRNTDCKIIEGTLKKICSFKKNRARAVIETYKLLRSGDYG